MRLNISRDRRSRFCSAEPGGSPGAPKRKGGAWFVIFGRLAAFGARLIGVPRGPDGPDTALLEQLAAQHKPKLFIVNSAVHNPTGHTLSAGAAYDILRIAERHDFMVVEDDTYGDLHPGGAMKLAVLDRLNKALRA